MLLEIMELKCVPTNLLLARCSFPIFIQLIVLFHKEKINSNIGKYKSNCDMNFFKFYSKCGLDLEDSAVVNLFGLESNVSLQRGLE